MTLGIGRPAVRQGRRPTTTTRWTPRRSRWRSRRTAPRARWPVAVVATIGTTSSTSVDPVAAIADIAAPRGRCGCTSTPRTPGVVALLPERRAPFAGWERADSIVVNPHKWLFTPLDARCCSRRRMDQSARRVQPRAGVPAHARSAARPVLDFNEYSPQLGRRFRALKLWMQIRWFGLDGLRRADRGPPRAGRAAGRVGSTPIRTGSAWRRCRSRRVCFRWRPSRSRAARTTQRCRDGWMSSTSLMDAVNADGRGVPVPHAAAMAGSRSASSIGNLRTEARHVERAWELLRAARHGSPDWMASTHDRRATR